MFSNLDSQIAALKAVTTEDLDGGTIAMESKVKLTGTPETKDQVGTSEITFELSEPETVSLKVSVSNTMTEQEVTVVEPEGALDMSALMGNFLSPSVEG